MPSKHTSSLPEHIRDSLQQIIPIQKPAYNICLYNFGSSNVAADTVSSYVFENYAVQIHTIVDRMVPAWVDEDVDVIIMSYSGNNQELEEVYDIAKDKTQRIHCITSGGILKNICQNKGGNLILIPSGLSDSEATGYEIGALINLYESLGIFGIRDAILETLQRIISYRDSVWGSDYPSQIARNIGDKIPVIYCTGELRAVHKRWKMQINQLLGKLAFSGELPEFDHNEIVSWTEDKDNKDFTLLILKTETESKLLDLIVCTVSKLLPENDVNLQVIELDGKLMERCIKGIILADAVVNAMEESSND